MKIKYKLYEKVQSDIKCPKSIYNIVSTDLPCIYFSCLHLVSIDRDKMEVECCWEEDAEGMKNIQERINEEIK